MIGFGYFPGALAKVLLWGDNQTDCVSVVSLSDVEEWQQALKWTLHCLTDVQSQQDVALVLQLLSAEDFRTAYSVYKAVSQQKSRVSPTSPLTVQAEDLCQEVQ